MFDAYLQIDGVPGECTAAGFEGMIEIQSFSHGVSQSASISASTAGGATSGRCSHQDFTITKELDKASPLLATRCCLGTHIPTITLTLTRAGGGQHVPYMEYKLSNSIISSVSIGGGTGSFPTEAISFNYGKIEWTYTQQKRADGGGGGKVAGSWNLEKNAEK
ncbi:MAG: type VI secretion system tube protein Hcp [bacterium]|nr:type VI secretion system tube protein Hcp [bacterium]